jgi:LysR family transcriptional regulator, flagellar master operon regulator
MDLVSIKTFLELAVVGNFSRVAERMHITQSTVSARIKVLEDRLSCSLFERTPSGVKLTPAGQRFHRYAVGIQQLWQEGRQEVALPPGYDGSVGIGIHMTLWQRFLPGWINWMRERYPFFGLHVETDYSERLTEYVAQGLLDVAVTHMPTVLPGLHAEKFIDDSLVMVSNKMVTLEDCKNKDYLYVDWSYGYREEHLDKLPHLHSAPINIGFGEVALRYLLNNNGFAYLPLADIKNYIEESRLYLVEGAPALSRPAYLVYPDRPIDKQRLDVAILGLKAMIDADHLCSRP